MHICEMFYRLRIFMDFPEIGEEFSAATGGIYATHFPPWFVSASDERGCRPETVSIETKKGRRGCEPSDRIQPVLREFSLT